MASFTPCVIHNMMNRWEINPRTGIETKRCVRCGRILDTRQGVRDPSYV